MCKKDRYFVRLDPEILGHETYTHESEDGTLRAWDVTVGNAIAQDGRPIEVFSLIDHEVTREKIEQLYVNMDWEYAKTTDITAPLLFIPLENTILLIDGWHRLALASTLNLLEMPMFLLTQEEADSILWLCLPPGHSALWR